MKLNKHGIIDLDAPKYIFKYQPITDYTLENLKNKKLLASHPGTFNDPFEFKFHQIGKNIQRNEIEQFIAEIENFKVICLTDDPYNILMWSHYADFHKGICLGFYNWGLTYPINYTDNFPTIDFRITDERQRITDIHTVLHTKSKVWEYEKERRICLVPDTPPEVDYPGGLMMIAFGVNTSREDKRKIRSIINDSDVMMYQCEFVEKEYKLNFKPAFE